MSCRLVMIEGVPGAGKTTTARYVKDMLNKFSVLSNLYLEGRLDHPADYDAVSYFEKKAFRQLLKANEYSFSPFEKYIEEKSSHYLIHYGRIFQEDLLKLTQPLTIKLKKNDIYNQKRTIYKALILDQWKKYSNQKIKSRSIDIFECCFLQNPVTTLLGVHNASFDEILSFSLEITDQLESLEPILIYLNQDDKHLEASFDQVIKERSKAWLDFVTEYVTAQGYGLENHLEGYEGLITFYQKMSSIHRKIYKALPMKKLMLNNPSDDWKESLSIIEDFINKALFEK